MAKSRTETQTRFTIELERDLLDQYKVQAAIERTTMTALTIKLMADRIRSTRKPE